MDNHHKAKPPVPEGYDVAFVTRIWHWRSKKYLNASDYGLKAFPIRRRR